METPASGQRQFEPSAFSLLCKAVNPFEQPSSSDLELIGMNFAEVWRCAEFHAVRPPFLKAIEQSPAVIDHPREVSQFVREHSFRALQMTSDLVQLNQTLVAANVKGVFFKGPVLAMQIFGAAHLREFNDIDLLVPSLQQEETMHLLQAQGYRPIIEDRDLRRVFFDYLGQHTFRSSETNTVVDLHWSLVGNNSFPVNESEVLGNRTTLELGGAHVPVPTISDLALILAGHGQKEGWASFEWVLDFAKFAAAFPDFDWPHAADRARKRGSLRSVLTAALLVERCFGQVIDDGLVDEARDRQSIVQEVGRIRTKHSCLAVRKHQDDLMGSFRLCEKRRQKARVWLGLLTTRTIGDYEAMPLPPSMWWTYRFTRPFRLFWRKLRRVKPGSSAFWETQKKI